MTFYRAAIGIAVILFIIAHVWVAIEVYDRIEAGEKEYIKT